MADQDSSTQTVGLAKAPGEDHSNFPDDGTQIGTVAPLYRDAKTGKTTKGPSRPLMGDSIPVKDF